MYQTDDSQRLQKVRQGDAGAVLPPDGRDLLDFLLASQRDKHHIDVTPDKGYTLETLTADAVR